MKPDTITTFSSASKTLHPSQLHFMKQSNINEDLVGHLRTNEFYEKFNLLNYLLKFNTGLDSMMSLS